MAAADERDMNRDPITDEPGAHPVGTGIGAAVGGAAAGAAAGAVGGPIGAAVGAVAGAVIGGLGGKAAAESVNPTAEEAYWRDNYTREPYYDAARSYDDYAPAYRYGVSNWSSYGGADFDTVESRLADDWERSRDRSTLDWETARPATKAAWNRLGTSGTRSGTTETIDNDDVAETLDDLVEVSRDGEYGFRACAEHTKSADLKTLLLRHADECAQAARELSTLVVQYGGKTDESGTTSGALHRGWVALRGSLAGYTDEAMFSECERGEDVAKARYKKALEETLPQNVRTIVQRQYEGVLRNHDQIKALRNALKASR